MINKKSRDKKLTIAEKELAAKKDKNYKYA